MSETAPKRYCLLRHTRLAVPPGTCYGQADVPLASTFEADAAETCSFLPWKPDLIWTSPAARCMRLADVIGAPLGRIDTRLLELNFGEWENRTWDSFRSPQSEAWAADPWSICPPGGETAAELHKRVGEVRLELLAYLKANAAARIAVITHAGVIRSWRGHATGRNLMDFFGEPVPHGLPLSYD